MTFDKFWMIANVAGTYDGFKGEYIPDKSAPKFLHPTREKAEKELLRLQVRNPDGEFVLLEAVAVARKKMVMVVEPIPEGDGVPF